MLNNIKIQIETKSNMKIRKGFDKFIDLTMKYLDVDKTDMTENEAYDIVKFINSSNTKLSKSYYILRQPELTEFEIDIIMEKYRNSFVESTYKNTNRRVVSKKFIRQNKSRGYSGFVNINDKKYYCRSQVEFIYLHFFHIEFNIPLEIQMESLIYHFDDISYKPDFLIFDAGNLIKIYEVKSGPIVDNEMRYRYDKIQQGFLEIGIEFEIVCDWRRILKTHPQIKVKLKEWKQNEAIIQHDMRGEKNPHFGVKHSLETRKKISQKVKEKMNDKQYKNKLKKALKEFWKSPRGTEVKIKLGNFRREEARNRKKKKNMVDPIKVRNCKTCKNEFEYRSISDKKRVTCRTNGCTLKYRVKMGKQVKRHSKKSIIIAYKTRIKTYCSLITTNFNTFGELKRLINILKIENKISKHFGLSEKTFLKYFETIDELKEELQWEN